VTALDLEERLTLPGLDPRRADLIVAGAVLLDTLLRRLGATTSRSATWRCGRA
jgi:exopolyphosphatase/pppGpp-phosphohydrolase